MHVLGAEARGAHRVVAHPERDAFLGEFGELVDDALVFLVVLLRECAQLRAVRHDDDLAV
ncbi:MAG: hypothetical protein ROZ64_02355 [Burkholderiaceae bacterium]|nr:hypothetical protein [Burkholderiaceae bacterium]